MGPLKAYRTKKKQDGRHKQCLLEWWSRLDENVGKDKICKINQAQHETPGFLLEVEKKKVIHPWY